MNGKRDWMAELVVEIKALVVEEVLREDANIFSFRKTIDGAHVRDIAPIGELFGFKRNHEEEGYFTDKIQPVCFSEGNASIKVLGANFFGPFVELEIARCPISVTERLP